jgi:hypothetical protein
VRGITVTLMAILEGKSIAKPQHPQMKRHVDHIRSSTTKDRYKVS